MSNNDAVQRGETSGGFSVDNNPTKHDVKNQYGQIVRSFITSEEITAKTGVLSWDLENLKILSTAENTQDGSKKVRKLLLLENGNCFRAFFA